MSGHVPHFLARLALDVDADSKTIRRAYARELKLIDQESDLPGFQLLREAYEAALAWAKQNEPHREPQREPQRPEPVLRAPPETVPAPAPEPVRARERVAVPVIVEAALPIVPEPVVVAPPPPPEIPPVKAAPAIFIAADNPDALAETVFERLIANTARIVDTDMLKDPSLLETELRNRLADEELFNINARNRFEARAAYLLFGEYTLQAGVLFGAAATVFGWEKDSRRLQPFGEAGAFLDRAIIERTMFQRQDAEELVKQRGVMSRLRQRGRPPVVQIWRDMIYVERMLTRFPNLMAIMVSRATVEEWRRQYQASPPAPAPTKAALDLTPEPVLAGYATKRRFDGAWLFIALVVAFYIWFIWNRDINTSSYIPSSVAESSEYPSYAPGADPSAPDYGARQAPAVQADMFDKDIVDNIAKDIQYTPAANAPYGKRTVVYNVLAAINGTIYGMNRLQRSMDPDYDEAVKAAIMRAKPLPISYRSPVRMEFSVEWKKAARRSPPSRTKRSLIAAWRRPKSKRQPHRSRPPPSRVTPDRTIRYRKNPPACAPRS